MTNCEPSHSLTSLDEWLSYLETIHTTEIDLGLARIAVVARRLSIDFSFAQVVTVAGTNGKGTTCAFLEQALFTEQRNVAVYSSPHIHRFNERLRLNQREVSDQQLIEAFRVVEQVRGDISLTYYEFTTLAAFVVLMQVRPQVIILEVGLGGRLDATNIIDANIAVVTTVDLDHQAFLGNDKETIGIEKAGIFRAHTPAIIGDSAAPRSVFKVAMQLNATIYARGTDFTLTKVGSHWQWQSAEYAFTGLHTGHVPMDNVATALMILQLLSIPLTVEHINQWLADTHVAGRMEYVQRQCSILLDVAHNPQAAKYLAQQLAIRQQHYPQQRIIALVGMLADKDIYHSLQPLVPLVQQWFVTSLTVARAAKAEQLQQVLVSLDVQQSRMNCFDNTSSAFKMAYNNASEQDLLLVFGSFYTVADIRQLLHNDLSNN